LPPAKRDHNEIADGVTFSLAAILREAHLNGKCRTLRKVHREMGYRVGASSWLQPDVSITHAAQRADESYFIGAPALVVEVISENNTAAQIDGKIQDYLAEGAIEVWILYPNRRHMWIYKQAGIAEQHSGPFQSELLGGATIDIAKFLQDQAEQAI
jgi:Uma2 family endonuclease